MYKLVIVFDKEYIDKVSGKNAGRVQLEQMFKSLNKEDIAYCESISRLGRNIDNLWALYRELMDRNLTVHLIKAEFNIAGSSFRNRAWINARDVCLKSFSIDWEKRTNR